MKGRITLDDGTDPAHFEGKNYEWCDKGDIKKTGFPSLFKKFVNLMVDDRE